MKACRGHNYSYTGHLTCKTVSVVIHTSQIRMEPSITRVMGQGKSNEQAAPNEGHEVKSVSVAFR